MDELKQQLKVCLATVYGFSLKTQFFHWNVEGIDFYQYHKLFEKIYDDVYGSVDGLAENIRKLRGYAPGSFTRFKELSKVEEAFEPTSASAMIQTLHGDNEVVLEVLNQTFKLAQDENQQGLMNFLADRIDQHQKWGWFLRATTKKGE